MRGGGSSGFQGCLTSPTEELRDLRIGVRVRELGESVGILVSEESDEPEDEEVEENDREVPLSLCEGHVQPKQHVSSLSS